VEHADTMLSTWIFKEFNCGTCRHNVEYLDIGSESMPHACKHAFG